MSSDKAQKRARDIKNMTDGFRKIWRSLLDVERQYSPVKDKLNDLSLMEAKKTIDEFVRKYKVIARKYKKLYQRYYDFGPICDEEDIDGSLDYLVGECDYFFARICGIDIEIKINSDEESEEEEAR